MKKLLIRLAAATALALVVILAPLAPSAQANVDVYITPGVHNVNGRQWNTTCEPYSSNVERCRTEIWATQISLVNGRYVAKNGWAFNNLTYKASPRARWVSNNLGRDAQWVSEGRDWYTECDSPTTGSNGCRSYIWGTAVSAQKSATGTKYVQTEGWMFNNMVRFTDSVYATYKGTGSKQITLPAGMDAAYVTLTYKGTDEFELGTLDKTGQPTYDGLMGVGNYKGSTVIGLFEEPSSTLYIEGKGNWTITVQPWTAAPKLTGPAKGNSDEVFWYYGPAANKAFNYSGNGRIQIVEVTDKGRIVVDTTGPYTGTLPLREGPLLILIGTDGGPWTIS